MLLSSETDDHVSDIWPEKNIVVAGGIDPKDGRQVLRVINWETKKINLRRFESPVRMGIFSSDKKLMAMQGKLGTEVVDVASGKTLNRFPVHMDRREFMLFTPDNKTFVTSDPDVSRRPVFWDIATGKKSMVPGRWLGEQSADISPDGKSLAYSVWTHLAVYDFGTGKVEATEKIGTRIGCIRYAPDGRTVAVGDWNGGLHMFPAPKAERVE